MADVQQLLQGMVDMNDSVAEAEQRAADAGILAAANNIERKGESPSTHATGAIQTIALKYQPQAFDREDDRWRDHVNVFRRTVLLRSIRRNPRAS